MTEPQAWVLIGTFTTAIFGMMALMTMAMTRVFRAEISGLRHELKGGMSSMEARLTSKLDGLDRDVQAIARHVFGEPT